MPDAAPPVAMRCDIDRLRGFQVRTQCDVERGAALAHRGAVPFEAIEIEDEARRLEREQRRFRRTHQTISVSGVSERST